VLECAHAADAGEVAIRNLAELSANPVCESCSICSHAESGMSGGSPQIVSAVMEGFVRVVCCRMGSSENAVFPWTTELVGNGNEWCDSSPSKESHGEPSGYALTVCPS